MASSRVQQQADKATASMRLLAGWHFCWRLLLQKLQRKIDKFTAVSLMLVFLIFVQLCKKEKVSNIKNMLNPEITLTASSELLKIRMW